ncbi:DUF4283 domain-containing protein/zf-CCHC_4 domain-containing protein [Cephalotus follicularis]|uniref:DUF4283 domain-containing protein/zf-CCHC_4 domain-containing protein n=1 Tax=Cephalotus follicularis TaxID=3775 RepID=A0A1Q3DJJ8_CEPFO|nr:DUF4283 domain-containing protein/zf-CCHC_4 domain-containing protein [Cephalotus follicularis]
MVVDGVPRAKPPPEVCARGALEWEHTLVAFLVGKRLPATKVKEVLQRKWGQVGVLSFHTVSNGVFLIKFENGHARDWVMDNGPWDIWGYHIALRKWTKGMSLRLEECRSIPVWVKLSNVPVHLWSNEGLSYIASVLGRPLYMDAPTTKRQTLTFARICVDMLATSSFPTAINLDLDDGSSTVVEVEYPWKPQACSLCKVFDHANKSCPKAVRREWLPKPVVQACRTPGDADGWITIKRKNSQTINEVPAGETQRNDENHSRREEQNHPHQPPKTPTKEGEMPITAGKPGEPTSASPEINPLGSKVVNIDGGSIMMDNNRGKAICTDPQPAGGTNSSSKKKKKKGLNGVGTALHISPND